MPPPTRKTNPNQQFKRLAILAIVAIIIISIASWFFSNGYLEVTTSGAAQGEITLQLSERGSDKSSTSKASTGTSKRLVGRGTYEVTVKQGDSHYFSVIKVGGFLSTTKVAAKLEPEKGRRFIGNQTSSCQHLLQDVLITYQCGRELSTLQAHMPATATSPTLTRTIPTRPEDVIEGLVHTKKGSVLILRTAAEADHPDPPHIAYLLGRDLSLTQLTELPDLNENKIYSAESYGDGFMVYARDFSELYRYPSFGEKPTSITVSPNKIEGVKPYTFTLKDDQLAITYTHSIIAEDLAKASLADKKEIGQGSRSQVVVQDDKGARYYTFDDTYHTVKLCGKNKLCMVKKTGLEVYDISGDSAKKGLIMGGVEEVATRGDRLLVQKAGQLVEVDLDSDTPNGTVQYTLAPYTLCGITPTSDSYILCLINGSNNVSLLIDQSSPTDGIDKKIAQLQSLTEIKTLTIYGRYIFLSPNAGDKVRDAKGRFTTDQTKLQAANNKINQEIQRLDIDRNYYKIRNSGE